MPLSITTMVKDQLMSDSSSLIPRHPLVAGVVTLVGSVGISVGAVMFVSLGGYYGFYPTHVAFLVSLAASLVVAGLSVIGLFLQGNKYREFSDSRRMFGNWLLLSGTLIIVSIIYIFSGGWVILSRAQIFVWLTWLILSGALFFALIIFSFSSS